MWHSVPLTLFWFVYLGSLGIFYPYFSLYLRENAGLSGTEVGLVLAISPLVGMLAQPFWGLVADRTGARARMLALLTMATALGYLGVGAARGFWPIVAATAGLALAGTAVFPMVTSVSFAILRDAGRHAFGRVRVWGTIGYFIMIVVFPRLLAGHGAPVQENGSVSQPGLGLMFPVTAALVFAAAIIAFFLPAKGAVALRAGRGDWRQLARNRAFLRFLLFSLCAHFLMHGPMWLFPLFVRARGGDLETIRNMWILMLVLEIPLVLLTGSGLKRLGARGLLAVGVSVGGARWFLCSVTTDGTLLHAVQALHGVIVVGLNLGSPLYLDVIAPERLRSTAQGVLSMVGGGVAATASNFFAGWLVDRAGIDWLYFTFGLGSLALGLLARWILPHPQRRPEELPPAGPLAADPAVF
ncbi:MAG TPA: MFS transporter [candidate division Zixibacteria bacterium]|nr:MFS transporter [candidate division Zixibacteria bacterium]